MTGIEFPDLRPPPKMGPGRRAVYRPNHKSFGAFMKSEQMRDVTADVAEDIVIAVSAIAPRSKGPGPHMADQYKVQREAGRVKVGGNVRVRVKIVNPDKAAALTEFGTSKMKASRQLRRAASEFGDFHNPPPED